MKPKESGHLEVIVSLRDIEPGETIVQEMIWSRDLAQECLF